MKEKDLKDKDTDFTEDIWFNPDTEEFYNPETGEFPFENEDFEEEKKGGGFKFFISLLIIILIIAAVATAYCYMIYGGFPVIEGGGPAKEKVNEYVTVPDRIKESGGFEQEYGIAGLTDIEKRVYIYLKDEIERIASGENQSSRIAIPVEILFGPADSESLGRPVYSCDTLGIDHITQENLNNLLRGFDDKKMISALKFTSPWSMYWFNNSWQLDCSDLQYRIKDGQAVFLKDHKSAYLSLYVSPDYSTGEKDSITTDSKKIAKALVAKANAKEVVRRAEKKNDIEKLEYYRDYIVNASRYNPDISEGKIKNYGNPWQPVWIFDEDPETMVVCEGYAKAFKYLCDMTNFNNKNIRCFLAEGYMTEKNNTENIEDRGHLWNILHMENGRNYIVDLTPSSGENPSLPFFLKGGTVDGEFIEIKDVKTEESKEKGFLKEIITTTTYTRDEFYKYNEFTEEFLSPLEITSIATADYPG